MRVHAVRLGPEYLVFLLIVLFAVPLDGLAACVRSGLMPILTRVTTAINSSMVCERWCQSGRLLSYSSSRFQPRPAGETTLPAFACRRLCRCVAWSKSSSRSFTVRSCSLRLFFSCGNHADRFPSRAPLQLISWLIPYWSAMALGTVNCSLLVTLGISYFSKDLILAKQPAGVSCAANCSGQQCFCKARNCKGLGNGSDYTAGMVRTLMGTRVSGF